MVYWKLTINDKKRGHFILKGSVIVNQIIRSPGIYYQEKLHETFKNGVKTRNKL
jgi:DNA-directed RNA polymerase beta subunit